MPTSHSFLWPNNEGDLITIVDVVQFNSGEVALIPQRGPSTTVQPADLPRWHVDTLIGKTAGLANYHRQQAARLDEITQRLVLMRSAAE